MSKLVGRRPVELNINSLQNNVIPIYDGVTRIWSTVTTASLLSGSVSLSGSNTLIGNQIISGSLNVTNGITGSLYGTASSLPYEVWRYGGNDFGIIGGPNRILGTLSDHDLVIYTSGSQRATFTKGGNFVLGQGLPDLVAQEKILIDAGETTSYNLIKGRGSADSYLQFNIQNQSTGSVASTDIAATADNGTESTIYVDMGINGSGFVHNPEYSVGYANDTYLLSVANDHWIGSSESGKITLFTGDNFDGEAHAKLILRPTNNHEISGSLDISGSLTAQSFIGPLSGTASYASNANTSSYAVTASYAVTSSLAINANNAINASTASYVTTAQTASYALQAQSASYWSGSITNAATASYVENAQTASYVLNAVSSSYALYSNQSLSSSYSLTASSADDFVVRGTLTAQTIVAQTITSSIEYITGSTQFGSLLNNTHQFTGSVSISGSLSLNGNNVITSDQTSSLSASYAVSSSYAANADLLDGKDSSIFATTGSNTFTSNQIISGSLSIAGDHNINAGNTNYIHGIGIENNGDEANQFITLLYTDANTSLTSSVEVSGNSTQLYVRSGSDINQFILYPTYAFLNKGLEAPSFTGSLQGTASYAITSSYANNANLLDGKDSTIFSTTGSNTFNGTQIISGSLDVSSGVTGSFRGNLAGTATYSTLTLTQNSNTNQDYSLVFVTSGSNGYMQTYTDGSSNILYNPSTNKLTVPVLSATSITGSLLGTSSFAAQALSSSYALTSSYASNADLFDGNDSTIFATTGSNTFKGTQTIDGNLFMSGSFRLVYNNDTTNNMLFGMFDGSTIYGPYYQLFGNQYSNILQRGGAEFVYDIRNNADANFHIASFDGYEWTQKFIVNDTGAQITGSLQVSNGITGSLLGTASYASQALSSSYASTASYADNFTVKGTLTAQTINVQTITSSIDFVTGSTHFGTEIINTHEFTGSVLVSGSINGLSIGIGGNSSTSTNIAVGYNTLLNNGGSNNIGIGTNALIGDVGGSIGDNNIALGYEALTSNRDGISNIGIGYQALVNNSNGENNIAIGDSSMFNHTNGFHNVSIGATTLNILTTGENNVSIGHNSGQHASGSSSGNIYIGVDAGPSVNTEEFYKLYIGNLIENFGTPLIGGDSYSASVDINGTLTVTNGITGSLYGTSSYAIQAITSSYANTSEWDGLNNKPISSSLGSALSASTTVVASTATASYSAAFFDYAVISGSNSRAGTVMAVWNGSSVEYTETSTKDIGNTSQVIMSADLSSGNIQLKATTTDAWTVKSLIRLI